jgi:TM2 domain-containing membrane protein YozV
MEDLRRNEVRELTRLTARLDPAQQTFFQAEYGRHWRNPTTALLLCVLLGDFGAHYFYFGRHRAGILRLLFCWTLVPWVLALVEARTIVARAYRYNASLANDLLRVMQGALDEQPERAPARMSTTLLDTSLRTTVTGVHRPAIAAPAVASVSGTPVEHARRVTSPESEVVGALWSGRETASADRTDPPLALEDLALQSGAATPGTATETALHDPERSPTGLNDRPSEVSVPSPWASSSVSADRAAYDGASAPDGRVSPSIWEAPQAPDGAHAPSPDDAATQEPAARALADDAPSLNGSSDESDESAQPAGGPMALDEPQWPSPAGAPAVSASEPAVERVPATGQMVPVVPGREDDPEPLPWFLRDARPAAAESHDPVLMYQVAPAPRRNPVRYGPRPVGDRDTLASEHTAHGSSASPTADAFRVQPTPATNGLRYNIREDVALATLGSALAAGLADLLRDRPTQPRTGPLPQLLADPPASSGRSPVDAALPPAVLQAPRDTSGPAADRDETASPVLPSSEPRESLAASDDVVAPQPSSYEDAEPLTGPAVDESHEWPGSTPSAGTSMRAFPADDTMMQTPPVYAAPAATHVSTPSLHVRRRTVQRVIVRKMAVLNGHMVAESTVERHVPITSDDAEMAERLRIATTDAAREALSHLMKQAPDEALPAIRMQLYALDNAATDEHLRAPRT